MHLPLLQLEKSKYKKSYTNGIGKRSLGANFSCKVVVSVLGLLEILGCPTQCN